MLPFQIVSHLLQRKILGHAEEQFLNPITEPGYLDGDGEASGDAVVADDPDD
uniref:Uncharacterized protein n=1 Tax=Oryza rufipogon TaxID=4529 RepID=A0A679BAF6_ORYRU|nr:hypothetical protein [Oryza rufipogon]